MKQAVRPDKARMDQVRSHCVRDDDLVRGMARWLACRWTSWSEIDKIFRAVAEEQYGVGTTQKRTSITIRRKK